jgi:CubicO group peptidase (beta-lactamase class C family)
MIRRCIAVLGLALVATTPAGAQQPPSIESRLAGFDDYMAHLLETWNAPGIGIGIVVKDKLVFAKGYGYRDYGKKLPYTPTTTQPIASNTKLFTAIAAGLLVHDGKLDWDKPIRSYVPSIKFASEELDRAVTMRDMLSHRTGISRHDALWYQSDLTQKDLFDRLRYLEPSAPLRTTFLYNNVMYASAGYAIELLSGKPWQTFVSQRLLQPLGMTCTTFTVAEMLETSEPAVPYSERRGGSELVRVPYYTDDGAIAPAGGMNSSVMDMSHWVIALLNGGAYNGTQVIPRDVVRETLTPSIALPNTDLDTRGWTEMLGTAYGIGRYAGSYRGHFITYHGGDIRGFHSQVSLMPADSIGVIVMVIGDHAAPLYNVVSWNIYERLLGLSLTPWSERFTAIRDAQQHAAENAHASARHERVASGKASHPIADYVGEFEDPAYGVLTISRADKSLQFDFHRIRLPLSRVRYDRFDTPDDEDHGRWTVNFLTGVNGDVNRAEMPIDGSVVVFKRRVLAALANVDTLRRYVGTYGMASLTHIDVVLRADSSLAIKDPRGGFQRLVPLEANKFRVPEFPGLVYEFSVVDGQATALKASDPAGELTFQRW